MRANRFTRCSEWMLPAFFAVLLAAACREPPRPGAVAPPSNPTMDEDGRLRPEGLGPFADQIVAAMGTRAEREARAPYSPPGWPYERGEIVQVTDYNDEPFGHWTSPIQAPFWVGKRVFGARWEMVEPPEGWHPWIPTVEYVGHFPQRTVDPLWFRRLPDHLADVNPVELQASLFDTVLVGTLGGDFATKRIGMDTLLSHWTEERWIDGYTGPGGENE